MSVENDPHIFIRSERTARSRRWKIAAGGMLVLFGALILVVQFLNFPPGFKPGMIVLALGMLLLGLVTRDGGWLIPGGILGGLAAGFWLAEANAGTASQTEETGIFLLAFAVGWLAITFLSIFIGDVQWWAMLPAGFLALVGGGMVTGGTWLTVLHLVGRYWPLSLIVLGAYVLLRRRR